jgi:hypothetical protein
MVDPDYREQEDHLDSLRAALHAAISLFHLSDWVFHTHENAVRAAFTYKDATDATRQVDSSKTFANALEQLNANFGLVRGICNAAKHLKLENIRPITGAPSDAANTRVLTTGYGAGGYGAGPYGGTARVMLEGPELEFSSIAKSVYEMWIALNETHHWW